jgi:hypothetical protein
MDLTTEGRYRVVGRPRAADELLLVDVSAADEAMAAAQAAIARGEETFDERDDFFAPTYVPTTGYEGSMEGAVESLEPGNLIDATIEWVDGTPRLREFTVRRRTRFRFCPAVADVFEAARETWAAARDAGDAMNARLTRSDADDPNGVVYTFAKQAGARDIFEEFADGVLPLEPLLRRVDEGADGTGAREVFVLRPTDDPFVVVLVALRRDGRLARTVRESYDCGDWADEDPADRPGNADGSFEFEVSPD